MDRKFRECINNLIFLKKFIYLISPNKIDKKFYINLDKVLSVGNSAFFQLRLKQTSKKKIKEISKKIRKITIKHKVKLIINDDFKLSLLVKANGCRLGQLDGVISEARKSLKNRILGITCHNSKKIAKKMLIYNPNYLAFGSFYKSRLKPKAVKANLSILKWAKKNIKKPVVAIGGINKKNYKKILKSGAKYIAISSYIWDNPNLKPEIAIREFK